MHRPFASSSGAVLLALATGAAASQSQPARPPACDAVEGFAQLDFWLGDWEVFSGDVRVGTNRIEKVLSGCAVVERWQGTGGGSGMSLFYFTPARGDWRQVWVTDRATGIGGVKEKAQVDAPTAGAVRFRGELLSAHGEPYLDRTTLTPHDDGTVHQKIEISLDGGASWRTTFDATYRPAREPDAEPAPRTELTTMALRVHHVDAMVRFYAEAFGFEFQEVDARGIRSRFGRLGGLTLKLVPLRTAADFEGYPIHQLGLEVDDVDRVIAIAERHGGRREGPILRQDGRIHAAVRDPDGNTIELYQR